MICLSAEFERAARHPCRRPDEEQRAAIDIALEAERFELYVQPIHSLRGDSGAPHYEVSCGCAPPTARCRAETFLGAADTETRCPPSTAGWCGPYSNGLRTIAGSGHKYRPFCINVSPESMTDDHFVHFVESFVKKSGLPPQALCSRSRTIRLLRQHQRGGIHAPPRSAGMRSRAR